MSESINAGEAMRDAAVKKAEVMCLGLHIDSARRIISALRALPLPEAKPDPRDDALAKARDALRAFLHLVTPGPNDDDRDGLEGLPDSFQFELVWAPNADIRNAPKEQFQDPTITAGQIRRARAALAALDAAKGAE